MSFLVSFNGQFSPYVYKVNLAHPLSPQPVQPVESLEAEQIHAIFEHEAEQAKKKAPLAAYHQQVKQFQQKRARVYARDIMSNPLHTIQGTATIAQASEIMKRMGFRHLPVLKGEDTSIGLISERETSLASSSQRVQEAMKPQVIVSLDSARIQDVAHLMLDEKINALPVINGQHKMVGIITLSDILKVVIHSDQFNFSE